MEIDAQELINALREQRNDALDQLAMARAALSKYENGDTEKSES